MHRKPHALHLLKERNKGTSAVHRDIHIDLIQCRAAQPVHKTGVVGSDGNPRNFMPDLVVGRLGNRQSHNAVGPILIQIMNHILRMVGGRNNAHQTLQSPHFVGVLQQFLERSMGSGHCENVDDRHKQQKVAGIQHSRLCHGKPCGIDKSQQKVEFYCFDKIAPQGTCDNISFLVSQKERADIRQRQQQHRPQKIAGFIFPHFPKYAVNNSPCQPDADNQPDNIR